jgi:multidrug resistance efflux pump
MLELLLCSLLTILPDYLYRRYWQGKRIGKDINLFSVWFELRWGIVCCLMLTVALITVIFYNHPSTSNVTSFFRTVPIVPEISGRVAEINVRSSQRVEKGAQIFRLDSSKQKAAVETARRRITELDAAMVVAREELAAADGQLQQAQSSYQQALDELQTKEELNRRNADIVARREIERLQNVVNGRKGGIDAATAGKQAADAKLSTLLPAQKASAEAALAEAEVTLSKTVVHAGVTGRVEQFQLQVGDVVNPLARPAGILIPEGSGRESLQAGFAQIEAQVLKVGMIGEVTCASKPWKIIPMVVTGVQDYIATGQFRGGEQLLDFRPNTAPGTILVRLEPLYDGGLDGVTPGSSCIATAYTNNHDLLASGKVGFFHSIGLHVVDTVGIVHAMLLRIQALLLPIQTLVFSGH